MYENIKNILKPKSKEEIFNKIKYFSIEDKQEILYNKGLEYFFGDFQSFLDFLERFVDYDLERIYNSIIDLIYSSGYNPHDESGNNLIIDKEWIKSNMSFDFIKASFLDALSEKQIEYLLNFFIPEYKNIMNMNENIKNILKPKNTKEINNIIKQKFNINFEQIREILNQYQGKILFLYIYERDWNTIKYSKNQNIIIKEIFNNILEATDINSYRKITVFSMNPNIDGEFFDEGIDQHSTGGIRILFEIEIEHGYPKSIVKLNLDF